MSELDKNIPKDVIKEIENYFMEYKSKIFVFVHARIKDKDVADDITQDVFFEAVRHYEIFSKHENKVGWLYKVVHYKMLEYYRKLHGRELLGTKDVLPEKMVEEEGYAQSELNIVVKEVLTQEEFLRFRRYFIWGEKIAEIAQKENTSEGNIRVKLTRLRKKIFEAIDEQKK